MSGPFRCASGHLLDRRNNFPEITNQLRYQMAADRQSHTQTAYTQIRSRILDGRLAPGHPVSPRNMADELMLGHMPVRSAIQRLVVEGLVEVIPRKGTYVTAPTKIDLREIFEVRLALESTAAYLAAVSGATDGLAAAAQQLRRVVDEGSSDLMTEQRIGWVFHQELFAAAKNDPSRSARWCCERRRRCRRIFTPSMNPSSLITDP